MESDLDKRRRLIWEAKGRRDVRYLIEAVQRDHELRDVAARFLGDAGDEMAIPSLLGLVDDSNPQVRAAAARALGRLQAQQAALALSRLARSDPVFFVRDWSMQALAEIGEPSVVSLALDALHDDDVRIRRSAAIVLGRVGSPEALDQLESAKNRDTFRHRRIYREASGAIRRAARRHGEERSLSHPSPTTVAAIAAPSKLIGAATVIVATVAVWLTLQWLGAPVWLGVVASIVAGAVLVRYLLIERRHRSRRSRLPLREPPAPDRSADQGRPQD